VGEYWLPCAIEEEGNSWSGPFVERIENGFPEANLGPPISALGWQEFHIVGKNPCSCKTMSDPPLPVPLQTCNDVFLLQLPKNVVDCGLKRLGSGANGRFLG
jgi:hypothetical protein